jgi:hypothetical protein
MGNNLLSAAAASQEAGVSRETVNYWIRKGLDGFKLPAVQVAGVYLIRRRDLDRFLSLRSGLLQPA